MSELRDAIDWMSKWSFVEDATKRELVVEATRRVANGVEIRYCTWHESRMPYGADHCQTADGLHACAPGDYLLVDDVHSIATEDDR